MALEDGCAAEVIGLYRRILLGIPPGLFRKHKETSVTYIERFKGWENGFSFMQTIACIFMF